MADLNHPAPIHNPNPTPISNPIPIPNRNPNETGDIYQPPFMVRSLQLVEVRPYTEEEEEEETESLTLSQPTLSLMPVQRSI